jgi:hypothetical protein
MKQRFARVFSNKFILIFGTALVTTLIVFNFFVSDNSNRGIDLEKISGKIALAETELKEIGQKTNQPIYWVGSSPEGVYTLTLAENEQSYVKYLPADSQTSDLENAYRIIATYLKPDAFSVTQSAGNQPGAVTLTNSEGAVIYYSSLTPNNVYLAYPGRNFQIEIFDPVPGAALELALTPGAVSRIN